MGRDILDIIIIVTLILFALRGLKAGLIGEIAGIVSLICGFWAARAFNYELAPYFSFISDPGLRPVAAGILIFFVVLFAIGLLAHLLKKLLSFSFAGWIDKLGGLLCGLAKGIIIWMLVFIVISLVVPDAGFLKNSRAYPYYEILAGHIKPLLPPEMGRYLGA